MPTICTSCPNTGRAISTGIETDLDSFLAMPDVITRVRCPHCGEEHNWSKYNAFLRENAPTSPPVPAPPRKREG
ncbi:MAG: hypothetical protein ACOY5F_12040 [Pseudomonadota bacterium]